MVADGLAAGAVQRDPWPAHSWRGVEMIAYIHTYIMRVVCFVCVCVFEYLYPTTLFLTYIPYIYIYYMVSHQTI